MKSCRWSNWWRYVTDCQLPVTNYIVLLLFFTMIFTKSDLQAKELYIGTASADITPKLPVALMGQFELRIAQTAETPLTANVISLESREGNRSIDAAIMVSCDLIGITSEMLKMVRDEVHQQIPELDARKIFLNATHTHTAPVLEDDIKSSFRYPIPKQGVLQVKEYIKFFSARVAGAIVNSWKNRRPGSVTWGLSHAAVAYNRRAVYADGSAQMYGKTNVPDFLNPGGMEDHDVNMLFFWDKTDKLIAMTIAVACPAQEAEHQSAVNADYWHPVREKLKQRFGPDLCVLGWISAAGDQSPRPIYRIAAEERMMRLRNLGHLEEIARRIVVAVEEAYETVKNDRYANVQLVHKVKTLTLPMRLVTEEEYLSAKAERDKLQAQIAADSLAANDVFAPMTWNADVVARFEKQRTDPNQNVEAEIHVLRIGDVAICTNEFELFTDYGIRIQARSNALQTFVIQLAAGIGATGPSYLATEKAVKEGGYSAIVQSNLVGPEGGRLLVNLTVEQINDMFVISK